MEGLDIEGVPEKRGVAKGLLEGVELVLALALVLCGLPERLATVETVLLGVGVGDNWAATLLVGVAEGEARTLGLKLGKGETKRLDTTDAVALGLGTDSLGETLSVSLRVWLGDSLVLLGETEPEKPTARLALTLTEGEALPRTTVELVEMGVLKLSSSSKKNRKIQRHGTSTKHHGFFRRLGSLNARLLLFFFLNKTTRSTSTAASMRAILRGFALSLLCTCESGNKSINTTW